MSLSFQTLNSFGPIELLGGLLDQIETIAAAQTADTTPSRHGKKAIVDRTLSEGGEGGKYAWRCDPDWDPFAKSADLVD